jgi:hypothetical protein
MSDQHRPLITRHGTHCICGVFCASGRDIEAWQSHVDDRVLLDDSAAGINPSPISEGMWSITNAFRKVSESFSNATRKIAQALEGIGPR